MDFRDICNFFGGTIFPEEYRTDFEKNDERIAIAASRLTQSSPPTTWASLLLLKALNAGMRGDVAAAQSHLTELSRLAESSLDARWRFRCRHYEFHLLCLQRFPPILRFRPNDDNDSAIRAHAQLSIVPRIKDMMSCRRLFASSNWSPIDKAESEMIDKSKAFINELWMAAYRHHPAFPMDSQAEMLRRLGIDLFTSSKPFPKELLELVETMNLPETFGYLKRLAVEHSLGAGLQDSMSMSSALGEMYVRRDDFIGAANCRLLQADNSLSPPFSSPLALNLMPLDQGLGWDNEIWDATEAKFPLRKVGAAERLYNEAFDLFSKGCSRRGQAAVEVRRGCVNHAEALVAAHAGRHAEAASLQISAQQNLKQAKRLFRGDSSNLEIVSTHQILLNISIGEYAGIEQKAFEIGERGRASQNLVLCQYLGLLLLRFGRMISLTSGADVLPNGKAILCCASARACFRGLHDPLLELQAIVAHAILHQRLGNSAFAKVSMVEGRQILPGALQSLDELAATCPEDMRVTIQLQRTNRLADFQSAHRMIYGQDFTVTSAPVSSMPSKFVEILDFVLQSNQSITSDYNQTLKDRHEALVLNADVETSDGYLRQFLSRWNTSSADTVSQEILSSVRLTVYHYLGNFDEARQVIRASVPVIYGGDNSSGFMAAQANSIIEAHRVASRKMLAEQSISHCFFAKDWQFGREVLGRIQQVLPGYPDGTTSLQNDDAWQLIVWIACIEEHCGNLTQAFNRYLQALDILETRRQQVADTDTRRDMFATIHSGEIYAGLARIAWHYSRAVELAGERSPHGVTWTDQVLLYLEQGRARALMDVLTASSGPNNVDDAIKKYSVYMSYVRKLDRALNSPLEKQQQIIHELGTEMGIMDATLTKIQTHMENLSLSSGQIVRGTYPSHATDVLYDCITDNSICIHINMSRDGMLLLGISSEGIQNICQNAITDIEVDRAILMFLKPFRLGALSDTEAYLPQLRLISRWIIDPMEQIMKDKEHVIFIPSRAFHKFPFSALLLDAEPLFLRKSISQAPSLSVLAHLAQKTKSRNSIDGAVVVRPGQDDSDDEEEPLPMAGMEAINISRIYGCAPRNATSLSSDQFTKLYESSDILHISTHGLQSGTSAWDSSLTLRERFSVLDLAKLQSRAALIVFSACVSSLGEDTIGNDMLGFSHGVIASGALAYLGALWNVNDEATMIMMVLFHRVLAERSADTTLAMCWRQAQKALYYQDNAKAKSIFEELRDIWDECEAEGIVPDDMSWQARDSIDTLIRRLTKRKIDYSHPYYWAPFVLVENGGLIL
jgi:CHAT domain-containing protein